jgi:L,D-peptidoglycan transpeptidase YkuD (ErfK/YbiS/YcfS/YnhG family)
MYIFLYLCVKFNNQSVFAMKKNLVFLFLLAFWQMESGCHAQKIVTERWATDLKTQQIVVVITPNNTATQGIMRLYEWRSDKWAAVSSFTKVKVGRNGLAWGKGLHADNLNTDVLKKEGDGKAPQGVFRLTQVFGYQALADTKWKMPYLHATNSTLCIDDTKSEFYNKIMDKSAAGKVDSYENMRREDDFYQYGIVVDYNMNKTEAGAGSCIFMHIQDETRPTSGCTAMPKGDLLALIEHLDNAKKPVLLQCTQDNYEKLALAYGLPKEWSVMR